MNPWGENLPARVPKERRRGGAVLGSGLRGYAPGAATGDRQMRQLDPEATRLGDGGDKRGGLASIDLPRLAATDAVQMAVLVVRHDVELFAAIGSVTVADEPELLEDV